MERCKVICHMMVSLDGKIDGVYMDAPGSEKPGTLYEDIIFQMGDSMTNGAATNVLYDAKANVDYDAYQGCEVPDGDHIINVPDGKYLFSFDRSGRCNWDRNYFDYAGVRSQIVEVITEKVPDTFRSHLRKLGISYIVAGKKAFADTQAVFCPTAYSFKKVTPLEGGGFHLLLERSTEKEIV